MFLCLDIILFRHYWSDIDYNKTKKIIGRKEIQLYIHLFVIIHMLIDIMGKNALQKY